MTLSRNFRVMPNPAHDILHLRLPGGQWSEAAEITLRDAQGRLLHREMWWGGAANLDMSPWSRGVVYVTAALADGAQVTRRIMLE